MLRRVPRADSQNLGAEDSYRFRGWKRPHRLPQPLARQFQHPRRPLPGKQPERGWLTRIFSSDGKVLSAASKAVATGPMWLLSTREVANATEGLN